MVNRKEYDDQFIGNEDLVNLISNVDPSVEMGTNTNKLKSITSKPGVTGAVAYLKQHFSEKYPTQISVFVHHKNITKDTLLNQLVTFVGQTLLVLCLKCDVDYTPMAQDDSAPDDVSCLKCKIPAHRTCYKKDDININQGLVYLCQCCLVNLGKEEDTDEEQVKDKKDEKDEKEQEDDSTVEESEADTDDSYTTILRKIRRKKIKKTPRKADDKTRKKEQLCPMLIDGNCPHGSEGKDCEYLHKKKCFRFINFGTKEMHKAGCKFGETCRYLHPTLCRNSVELKTCLNQGCQYAHLKKTHLKNPRDIGNSYGNPKNPRDTGNSYGNQRNSYGYRKDQKPQRPYPRGNQDNSQTTREEERYYSSGSRGSSNWQQRPQNTYQNNEEQYNPSNNFNWHQRNGASNNTGNYVQNQSFLEERLERMQQEFLVQMQKQVEAQFKKMWESYEEYPSLEQQSGW